MMNPTKQKILENILYIFFYTHTHTHTKQPSMSNQTDDKQKLIKNLKSVKNWTKQKTKKKEHKE